MFPFDTNRTPVHVVHRVLINATHHPLTLLTLPSPALPALSVGCPVARASSPPSPAPPALAEPASPPVSLQ